jgi:hypothetical protein
VLDELSAIADELSVTDDGEALGHHFRPSVQRNGRPRFNA